MGCICSRCFGITPDISALFLFKLNERIYYIDAKIPFPDSKEKVGHFVGIADNVIGDALTFWILTKVAEQLIVMSILRELQKIQRQAIKDLSCLNMQSDPLLKYCKFQRMD